MDNNSPDDTVTTENVDLNYAVITEEVAELTN